MQGAKRLSSALGGDLVAGRSIKVPIPSFPCLNDRCDFVVVDSRVVKEIPDVGLHIVQRGVPSSNE